MTNDSSWYSFIINTVHGNLVRARMVVAYANTHTHTQFLTVTCAHIYVKYMYTTGSTI